MEKNKYKQQPIVRWRNRESQEEIVAMEEMKEMMREIMKNMAQNTNDL